MKVKQLIENLQAVDPELVVYAQSGGYLSELMPIDELYIHTDNRRGPHVAIETE